MYTIKEAAARSGVNVATLRAWERRYQVVAPHRTSAGYRLYDDAAIARLKAMQQLIGTGWRARQAAEEVTRLGAVVSPDLPQKTDAERTESSGSSPLIHDLIEAARGLDPAGTEQALDEAFARSSFEAVLDGVVTPALEEIGRSWASGTLDVAGEHAASQAVQRRLAAIFDLAARGDEPAMVLVGLPPGCRHELGALAFAIAARRRGLGVIYLGADVPVESWVSALRQTGARAIAIGVPTSADVEPARAVLAAVRATELRVVCLLGGRAAAGLADEPGITLVPRELGEAARIARQVVVKAG